MQVKLPAEEMAKELTMKTKVPPTNEPAHIKPLRINPFTASVSSQSSSPTQKSASSHLLMKPVYSTLPTFTPMPVTESNLTSSSILKDVLKDDWIWWTFSCFFFYSWKITIFCIIVHVTITIWNEILYLSEYHYEVKEKHTKLFNQINYWFFNWLTSYLWGWRGAIEKF